MPFPSIPSHSSPNPPHNSPLRTTTIASADRLLHPTAPPSHLQQAIPHPPLPPPSQHYGRLYRPQPLPHFRQRTRSALHGARNPHIPAHIRGARSERVGLFLLCVNKAKCALLRHAGRVVMTCTRRRHRRVPLLCFLRRVRLGMWMWGG